MKKLDDGRRFLLMNINYGDRGNVSMANITVTRESIREIGDSLRAVSVMASQKAMSLVVARYIEKRDEVGDFVKRHRERDSDGNSSLIDSIPEIFGDSEGCLDIPLPLQIVHILHEGGIQQRRFVRQPFNHSTPFLFGEELYLDDPGRTLRWLNSTLDEMRRGWPSHVVEYVDRVAVVDFETAVACLSCVWLCWSAVNKAKVDLEMEGGHSGGFSSREMFPPPPVWLAAARDSYAADLASGMDSRFSAAVGGRPVSNETIAKYNEKRNALLAAAAQLKEFINTL